ncbi:MAG: integrase [Candidatus Azotimanducaceae bacterium]|jgi:integrase
MALTATAVKQAKPKEKQYKLFDSHGLFLLVHPNGGKYWRFKYRFAGKEKLLSLGIYPDLSLAEARVRHQQARETLSKGIDPGEALKIGKLNRHLAEADTFETLAREWLTVKMCSTSAGYQKRILSSLERDLFPLLGSLPVTSITAPRLLAALRRIEARGVIETANRTKQIAGQIFRYAIATGRAEQDPSKDLTGALQNPDKKHFAAITKPAEVGQLLQAINEFRGTTVVRAALRLSPLLFQRPGEMRAMEWDEIDFEAKRWEIPGHKMKMRQPHIVPLSDQALKILRDLQPLTGQGKYVFPNARGASRCLSENGVRVALRTMGYDNDTMTPHGFRAMARTLLDEVLDFRVDWIEHQLAHAVKDPNGRAYNRTAHLEGRAKMMQGWADYLDQLRN